MNKMFNITEQEKEALLIASNVLIRYKELKYNQTIKDVKSNWCFSPSVDYAGAIEDLKELANGTWEIVYTRG